MAKRMTDSTKWDRENFQNMHWKMKLCWLYLLDKCDHAGIWPVNMGLLSFQIGEKVSLDELKKAFGKHIIFTKSDKMFIKTFIDFQYGTLRDESKVHKSVIEILKKEGVYKGYTKAIHSSKDKDKEKDKEKEKETLKKWKPSNAQLRELYDSYPRRRGFTVFAKRAKTIFTTEQDLQDFKKAVDKYSKYAKQKELVEEHIKLITTFLSEYKDWLEGDAGTLKFKDGANELYDTSEWNTHS